MTLIYKKKIKQSKEQLFKPNNTFIIDNSINNQFIKGNWFKGSRDRGVR